MALRIDEEKIPIKNYSENQVGNYFKASKTEYVFDFDINGKSNIIKLLKSAMTGKMRVYLNENLIHFDQK